MNEPERNEPGHAGKDKLNRDVLPDTVVVNEAANGDRSEPTFAVPVSMLNKKQLRWIALEQAKGDAGRFGDPKTAAAFMTDRRTVAKLLGGFKGFKADELQTKDLQIEFLARQSSYWFNEAYRFMSSNAGLAHVIGDHFETLAKHADRITELEEDNRSLTDQIRLLRAKLTAAENAARDEPKPEPTIDVESYMKP